MQKVDENLARSAVNRPGRFLATALFAIAALGLAERTLDVSERILAEAVGIAVSPSMSEMDKVGRAKLGYALLDEQLLDLWVLPQLG